jgi:hypothetical protein
LPKHETWASSNFSSVKQQSLHKTFWSQAKNIHFLEHRCFYSGHPFHGKLPYTCRKIYISAHHYEAFSTFSKSHPTKNIWSWICTAVVIESDMHILATIVHHCYHHLSHLNHWHKSIHKHTKHWYQAIAHWKWQFCGHKWWSGILSSTRWHTNNAHDCVEPITPRNSGLQHLILSTWNNTLTYCLNIVKEQRGKNGSSKYEIENILIHTLYRAFYPFSRASIAYESCSFNIP